VTSRIKVVLSTLFIFSALLYRSGATEAEPLRIAYSVISWTMSAAYMAEDAGLFKKNGLDVQLIHIPSSGTSVQALLGGSVGIITPGSSGVIIAVARGVPIVTVAASTRRAPFTLFVQPELIRADQLKGKVIGVTRFNSTSHMMAVLILRKIGLEESVSVRQLGDSPSMHNAFERKVVAGMVTAVKPRLAARPLADGVELDIPYASSMVTVSRSYLQESRDTVERVMRAYIEGMALLLNQKEAAKRVFAKYIRRNDPEFLEETYDTAKKYLEPIPRVDPRIVAPVLEYAGIKNVDPNEIAAKVIDNSVMDKLQKEPFIESLFGKKR
jgi:NitT/TauT family transport system substrate-binding protein